MILFKKQNPCVSYLLNNQVVIEILVLHITWRERGKILKYTAFCAEQNTDYSACLKNALNVLLPKYIKWISRDDILLCVFIYANIGCLKVNGVLLAYKLSYYSAYASHWSLQWPYLGKIVPDTWVNTLCTKAKVVWFTRLEHRSSEMNIYCSLCWWQLIRINTRLFQNDH